MEANFTGVVIKCQQLTSKGKNQLEEMFIVEAKRFLPDNGAVLWCTAHLFRIPYALN